MTGYTEQQEISASLKDPDDDTFTREEICERTGFESQKREECQEVKEIQCEPVQVTKFRTEIKQECQTKKDQVRSLNIQFDRNYV